MLELDITDVYNSITPCELSGSCAELGDRAGEITWNNSLQEAKSFPALLDSQEKVDAAREHFLAYGAWEEDEVVGWGIQELTALVLQEIAADIRESVLEESPEDWDGYYKDSEEGFSRGRLFENGGRVYYYLGE